MQDMGGNEQADYCDRRRAEGGSIVFHTGRTNGQARRSGRPYAIANRDFTAAACRSTPSVSRPLQSAVNC